MKDLILLHAALGNKDQVRPLGNLLSKDFVVHYLDFEGHGLDSNSIHPFSLSRFSDQLKEFIELNNLENPHVFGYSLGGYVAIFNAFSYPSMVGDIACFATRWDWNLDFSAKEARKMDPDFLESRAPVFVLQLQEKFGLNNWRTVVQRTSQLFKVIGHDSYLFEQNLTHVQNRVLLLRGSNDHMVSSFESERMANKLPHGKYLELGGFGHDLAGMDMQRLADSLNSFFKKSG